ncbi:transmembrane transport [Ascochyta rabiei]|uniref:Transmembrane transport n=1 Tax=Didymella rabiei TaxID=5454 RepID=A0A163F289_DIDRA|nr:transmembrane transport [Ascochyta rabiei]
MILYDYDSSTFNAVQGSKHWVAYFHNPSPSLVGSINTAYNVGGIIAVYFTGFAVYVGSAWYSDKIQQRGIFCMGGFLTCILGYIFLIANQGAGLSLAGCFIVAMGLWKLSGTAFTWISVNNPRYGKRAFASGMQINIGNAAGVSAPFLFSSIDAPAYYPGYGATIALLALGTGIYATLHFWYRAEQNEA